MSQVFHAKFDGKFWQIRSVHGHAPHQWAWLVNLANPDEQVRLSMNSDKIIKSVLPPLAA